jgi:hypothetical protein
MRGAFLLLYVSCLAASAGNALAIPARPPKNDQRPPWREEPPKPGVPLPVAPPKQRIFGIGVGFDTSGTLAGVALKVVLPGSPAARAGLVVGCVIAEINGESTIGRPGDDCARIIREALGTVRIKYLDPALKEKTLILEKEWIVLPE